MKSYVLITGASSGIGYELAHVFASHHHNLIIVGRNKEKMEVLKKNLEKMYLIKVKVFQMDLGEVGAAEKLYKNLEQEKIEILINNAGAGYVGAFEEKAYEVDEELIQLNISSLTVLTKLILKKMKQQGEGKILNVASTGAYHPGPYTAVYYATKAYVLSFTEALAIELKDTPITVSVLCPGATKTGFAKHAGKENANFAMNPKYVAEIAYKALMKNKRHIVPGLQNKLFILLPRRIAAYFIAKYQSALKH